MSKAKKCDRCGSLYELYNCKNSNIKINGLKILNIDEHDKYYSHGPYDLCPTCSEEFTNWFRKENNND